jgi:hypothetical protein
MKKGKILVIISVLIIIISIFYWYEIRPSQIMKECSWMKVVKPAKEAVTKEEAGKNKKIYEECMNQVRGLAGWEKLNNSTECDYDRISEREYVPEEVYYEKASKDEYNFCIHANGLK